MNCTHPVLYSRNGELYCHICGAALPLEILTKPKPATEQPEGQEEKPAEAPKRKRKAKGADGNENH